MSKVDLTTVEELVKRGMLTREQAQAIAAEHAEAVPTLDEALNAYVDNLRGFNAITAQGYKSNVTRFYSSFIEAHQLQQTGIPYVIKADVQEHLKQMVAQGYRVATVRRIKYALVNWFEFLHKTYRVEAPDISDIDISFDDDADINALHHADILRIAESADNIRDKAMIRFLYETGMTRQELLACEKSDVFLDQLKVDIYTTNNVLDRVVYFSEECGRLLTAHLEAWHQTVIDTNEARKNRAQVTGKGYTLVHISEYLFQTLRGDQMNYQTVLRAIKEAAAQYCENSECDFDPKDLDAETLRNSRRAYLFAIGKTTEQVQAIMGDANTWKCKRFIEVAQRLYPESFR